MFGAVPTIPGTPAWGPASSQPWMVQDPTVNQWLDVICSVGTKRKLENLEADLRAKVCASVYTRCLNNPPMNPEAYLNGAINQELRNNFGPAHHAVDPSKAHLGPYAPQQGRPPASPQQAPSHVQSRPSAPGQAVSRPPRPGWVEEAFALRGNTREFMRFLSRHLPAGALEKISTLPGQLQHQVLVAMILLDAGSTAPVQFLENCVEQFRSFPQRLSHTPSLSTSDFDAIGRRKLLILGFGNSTGLEWPAVDVAIQIAKEQFKETFQIVQRCSFVSQNEWKEVFEEICVNMNGSAIEFCPLEDALTFVQQRVSMWKAAGCTLLALIHIPKPEHSTVPPISAAPGYHSRASGSLWSSINVVKSMNTFFPEICVVAFQPASCSRPDTEFFDNIFGKSFELQDLRLPTDSWVLRCQPVCPNPVFCQRPFRGDGIKMEDIHQKLLGALDPSQTCPAKLPSLPALESWLDSDPGSAEHRDGKESADLAMRQQGGAFSMFLSREQLAAICGVQDFRWIELWQSRMPCSKFVNTVTGQPSAPGCAECVSCGQGRWCPNCSYYYEALTETVNPYQVSNGVVAVLQALSAPPGDVPLFATSRLPEHLCGGQCPGFTLPA